MRLAERLSVAIQESVASKAFLSEVCKRLYVDEYDIDLLTGSEICQLPFREPTTQEIRAIETQTRKHVEDILSRAGIPRGSELEFYGIAKKLIFRGCWIDSVQYDRILRYVGDYLCL